MSEFKHIPIMLNEVMSLIKPERGGIYADGTLGGGGHSEAILKALPENGKLYGIDRDMDAISAATKRLEPFGDKFTALHGNFFDMKRLMQEQGVDKLDGILMDLGVSSYQLDAPERGFSYKEDAPLDMRMDKSAPFSAYDVVNGYTSEQLFIIIKDYGEERYASRIANAIVRTRQEKPIETTLELANIIARSMPGAARREAQHPAKRTFQAIRIEVNNELGGLEKAIENAHDLLAPGGVMAVITFHSLEDRIIKQAFRRFEKPCTCDPHAPVCTCGKVPTARILTKKPLTAGEDELEYNPRARSAKLRAIEKI